MAAILWVWLAVVAIVVAIACLWYSGRKGSTLVRLSQAKRRFHVEREQLEAKFVRLAAGRSKLDARVWVDCSFADDVAYVRNRTSGELSAFVAMTIASDDLDQPRRATSETVGNLQAGTAVFRFDRDHWVTDGRAILNLSPGEAVHFFREDLEIVAEDFAHRSEM